MNIAIIGLGNILRGDDGLGIYVIRMLKALNIHYKNVNVVECDGSAICVLNHMQNMDKVIIIDSIIKGNKPGTIYYFKVSIRSSDPLNIEQLRNLSLHDLKLEDVLLMCKALNQLPKELIIIGCEPREFNSFKIGLSKEVKDSLIKIVDLVLKEIGATLQHISLKDHLNWFGKRSI